MNARRLTVLGTSAGVPTRRRNHNGYALRWDDELLLFDPGEGMQRQMLLGGVSAAQVTRICITHFHGDHCLGLPGVLLRRSRDRPDSPVDVYFPAEGVEDFNKLATVTTSREFKSAVPHPVTPGFVGKGKSFMLTAMALAHRVPALGWRLDEPDGQRLVPERLEARGISGPDIGRLVEQGVLDVNGRRTHIDEVSLPRPGQRFAFIMDTGLCNAVFQLAAGVDLLVCEATFLERHADLAREYGHLTAGQAGRIAAEAGVRRLVLTHFSPRYGHEATPFLEEARQFFDDVVAVDDLDEIDMPPRST